jgi:hypothetical protein
MEQTCHRCGAPVREDENFCPACGAPQLKFEPEETAAAPGSPASPAWQASLGADGVAWAPAVRAAALMALPTGLLVSSVVPGALAACCLWAAGGAMLAVALYRRGTGLASIDPRTGVRVGGLTGIFASVLAAALDGTWLVTERYGLHRGALLDAEMRRSFEQTLHMLRESGSQSSAGVQSAYNMLMAPEGRAGAMLMNRLMLSLGVVVFSAVGGALGARFFSRPAQAARD